MSDKDYIRQEGAEFAGLHPPIGAGGGAALKVCIGCIGCIGCMAAGWVANGSCEPIPVRSRVYMGIRECACRALRSILPTTQTHVPIRTQTHAQFRNSAGTRAH